MDIRLSTLGTVGLTRDGAEVASLPGKPVTFGLLVYLAVEGTVTRDKAAAVFWPESDTERARANLSQTLYELKQELGEGWVEKRGNLLLTGDSLWVDTRVFQEHLEEGRHQDAANLYRGHFLDGVFLAQTHPFEEWVEHTRGHLRRLHREALEGFIELCRGRGELPRALAAASGWVGLDPLCETAQHSLILLLAESGNREEALAQYDRYASHLAEELGLEPVDETRDLVKEIRRGALKPIRRERETAAASPGRGFQDRAEFRRYLERELAPRLQVLRPIGEGSMAEVFLARDPALKVLVAVKVLAPDLSVNEEARLRFEREAETMASLDLHPNVCGVKWTDVTAAGLPYLVMPFIRGTTLAHRLEAEGRLSPGEVRCVLLEVASALAAAHRRGIVHRDVRPDNILREEETGKNLLSDFGIAGVLETGSFGGAKLTHTGKILGHPAFISPEQIEGRPPTDRSDIYSLGVTGYQLLTGRTPPPEAAGKGKMGRQAVAALEEYARSFDPIDRRLVELISRCLARNPHHRPTAADIERRLKEDEWERTRGAGDGNGGPRPWEHVRSRRLPQIIGAYVAGTWLALELAQYLVGKGLLNPLAESALLATAPFGFLVVTVLGWFHGRPGRQVVPPVEKWLLGAIGVAWIGALAWMIRGP